MASKSDPPKSEQKRELKHLAGLVERVTFHNAENGFCVLRLKVKGERDLITLVGHTPSVTPGEYASASGTWVADREHGRQFKAVFVKISPPIPSRASSAIWVLAWLKALALSMQDGW